MPRPGCDPATVALIESRVAAGETVRAIATALGLSNGTVGKRAKLYREREGVSLSPKKLTPEQIGELERLVTLGVAPSAIARDLNLPINVVYQRGFKIRKSPGFRSLANGRLPTGKLPSDVIAKIRAMALTGKTYSDIARELQIRRKTVANHARSALVAAGGAVPERSIALPAETVRQIEVMVSNGRTEREIAAHFGITNASAHKYTHRFRRAHGLRLNSMRKPTQEEIAAFQRSLAEGATMKEAAQAVDLPVWKTWRAASEFWNSPAGIFRKAEREAYRAAVIAKRRAERDLRTKRAGEYGGFPTSDRLAREHDDLFARIASEVSPGIDAALRDDIIMDVYLAILEEQINGPGSIEGDGEEGDFDESGALSVEVWAQKHGRSSLFRQQENAA